MARAAEALAEQQRYGQMQMQEPSRVQNSHMVELGCISMDWVGLCWSGLDWNGMEFDAE